MFFRKKIEATVTNNWLKQNLKILPWILIVAIGICILQYVLWRISPEETKRTHAAPVIVDYIFSVIQISLLPLGAINAVYLFKTTSFYKVKRKKSSG